MNGYLILCTDGDSSHVALVNEETWTWFSDRSTIPGGTTKPPEGQIVRNALANACSEEEAVEYLMGSPDSGSFANDIALMLTSDDFDGETFEGDSVVDLFAFCNRHGIKLAEEFMGMIY